MVAVSNS